MLVNESDRLQFSEALYGHGSHLFRVAAKHGLGGMVSKRIDSVYRGGRAKDWLKCKCFTESELVVIGTDRDRKTGAWRALLARQDMTYAGASFIVMSSVDCERLLQSLQHAKSSLLPRLKIRDTDGANQRVAVRAKHLAGNRDQSLRHASVKQLSE